MAEDEQVQEPSSDSQGFMGGSEEASVRSRLPSCRDPFFDIRSPGPFPAGPALGVSLFYPVWAWWGALGERPLRFKRLRNTGRGLVWGLQRPGRAVCGWLWSFSGTLFGLMNLTKALTPVQWFFFFGAGSQNLHWSKIFSSSFSLCFCKAFNLSMYCSCS